jgi:hypothetical protein
MNNPSNSGGGFPPWGMGPGQRDIIHRTEQQEIKSVNARAFYVSALNVFIVVAIMISIVLIGPLAVPAGGCAAIVLCASWLVGWPMKPTTDSKDAFVNTWIIAAVLFAGWLVMADILWEPIVDWYPIKFALPWWAIVPVWLVIGAFTWGLLDGRNAHRRNLMPGGENDPPTYEQAPWWSAPSFVKQFGWMAHIDEPDPDQIIVEVPVPRPVPILNNHETAQSLPSPETEPTKKREVFKAPPLPGSDKGITILWKEFVQFIWEGLDVGISTPVWHKRTGWGKPYISALQATARQHGLAEYRGKGSENVLTIKTKAEAAAAIRTMHRCLYPEQYPPTPPSVEPSTPEGEPITEGRKVEGEKEG